MDASTAAAAAANSSSNQSSSSISSGYSSATTTPTTPLGSNYESHSNSSATAQPGAEPTIPVATVAAVAPFYNEAITATEAQRQQYYQSYAYPEMAHTVSQYGAYDSYIGGMVTGAGGHYGGSYQVDASSGNGNKHPASTHAMAEKRASLPHVVATHSNSNNSFKDVVLKKTSESSAATTKPQAAATPFYAQPPIHATKAEVATYYDPYKYKMPMKLPNPTADYAYGSGYGSYYATAAGAASASYQQQQQYYAAAKSQLQDASYTATVKPLPANNNARQYANSYYGAAGSSAPPYYDKYEKYMYATSETAFAGAPPLNSAATYAPAPHPPTHYAVTDSSVDCYRKSATSSWHWNMEYPIANCRSLPPPPPNSLPTAAVLPTNATYLPQANSAHDAFLTKYDKYSPSAYYQQYMSTGAGGGTRNAWTGSHAHHLSAVAVPERLPHAHTRAPPTHPPPPTYSHAVAQHFHSPNASTAARQSCCSQPAYQQQSCYYPHASPHPMANSYPPQAAHPQPTSFSPTGVGGHINKYGGNMPADYTYKSKAIKPPNDLYAAPPYDTPAATHLNYSYGATSNRYATVADAMAPAATQQVANRNAAGEGAAAYYNDLSLQTPFDNYATAVQQSAQQQHQEQQQQQQQQHAIDATRYHRLASSNQTKSPLLGYRKSSKLTADYYLTQPPLPNLESHAGYSDYTLANNANPIATAYDDGGAGAHMEHAEKSPTNTKNLSLRDFLTTWNEDEEDFGATNELNYARNEAPHVEQAATMLLAADMSPATPAYLPESATSNAQQLYKHAAPTTLEPAQPTAPPTPTSTNLQQNLAEQHSQFKSSLNARPKMPVGISVDSTLNVETNQYMNLPDIVIDIEKPSNVAAIAPHSKDISFSNFDVEKELDELQSKKAANLCSSEGMEAAAGLQVDFGKHAVAATPSEQKGAHNAAEISETSTDNAADAFASVPAEQETPYDNPEQFLKDIDEFENNHSNESTFEKEYETFINKIDNDISDKTPKDEEASNSAHMAANKVEDFSLDFALEKHTETSEFVDKLSAELKSDSGVLCPESKETPALDENEYVKNVNNFSKFHKRKRKLMEASHCEEQHGDLASTKSKKTKLEHNSNIEQQLKKSNFPQVYTKKCRKRKQIAVKHQLFDIVCMQDVYDENVSRCKPAWKPLAAYYKILRRFRCGKTKPQTSKLVQQRIAKLRERRLPLIKRQSVKKYASDSRARFNPKSLKGLSVSFINTEAFRSNILKGLDTFRENANLSLDEPQSHATDNEVGHKPSEDTKMEAPEAEADADADMMSNADALACSEAESGMLNESSEREKINRTKNLADVEATTLDLVLEPFEQGADLKHADTDENFASLRNKPQRSESEISEKLCHISAQYDELNTANERERAGLNLFGKAVKTAVHEDAHQVVKDGEREREIAENVTECEQQFSRYDKLAEVVFEEDSNSTLNDSRADCESSDDSSSSSSSSTDSSSSDEDGARSTCSSDTGSTASDAADASDLNEMEELAKELTLSQATAEAGAGEFPQHSTNTNAKKTDDSADTVKHINNNKSQPESMNFDKKITRRDIVDLKRILESDSEENNNDKQQQRVGAADASAKTTDTNTLSNGLKSAAETRRVGVESERDNVADTEELLLKQTNGGGDQLLEAVSKAHGEQADLTAGDSSSTVPPSAPPTATVADPDNSEHVAAEVGNDAAVQCIAYRITVPKLSDLCKIALSTSLSQYNELSHNNNDDDIHISKSKATTTTTAATTTTTTAAEQRELSVEEALAEMYRQAGVISDPEDYDMDEQKEAQDVLLINLEEILESDSDVYVLQCDMNENILGVVAHTAENVTVEQSAEGVESTLQLVEILNADEIDRYANEMQTIDNSANAIVLNGAAHALNTTTNGHKALQLDNAGIDIDRDTAIAIATDRIELDDALTTSQFDMPIPTIHHEEIVPENYKTFEKEKFIKYLHAKYVQKNISKFYHANNILRKYKRRLTRHQKIQ